MQLVFHMDSNSKSDLQGHSKALPMVLFDKPHTISCYSSIVTMSLSCIVSENSEILSHFPKFRDHVTLNVITLGSNISHTHSSSSVSISTRNLKCLASPVTKIWLDKI